MISPPRPWPTGDELEQREMDADMALFAADPDFARSIGVDLRKWLPPTADIGGSASGVVPPTAAPNYQATPGWAYQAALGFPQPPPNCRAQVAS